MNDGTAFPFVMLGLGLIGLHELGINLSRWIVVDLVWASFCGILVGTVSGIATSCIVHNLRKHDMDSEYMDDFLGLGLIGISYGLALILHGYGFLAVFAAAYSLRQTEFRLAGKLSRPKKSELSEIKKRQKSARHPESNFVTEASLFFNEQLERLVKVVLIILIGGMLFWDSWQFQYMCFALVLFFIIRPVSVYLGLFGASIPKAPKMLSAWFGVRGIGSLYYLMYAIQHGLPEPMAVELISVVLLTVTMSIIIHGISVTPLMDWYSSKGHFWSKTLPGR